MEGLNGCGFGWTLGVGDGQGGLVCCNSWGRRELNTTEQLNWTEMWGYARIQSFSSVIQSCLFATPWTAAHQASLSITNFRSLFKLMSIKLVIPSNHLIPVIPFSSHLQSFPASGSFLVSQFFTSGGQIIRVSASASVFPHKYSGLIPLGWTGWISLKSNGLSRVFSNTTVQKHQFFGTELSL